MEKSFSKMLRHKKLILAIYLVICVGAFFCKSYVGVNYNMNDYLPEDSPSSVAIDVMEQEFEGGIPNARVMLRSVEIPEALEIKKTLGEIDGVEEVTWLDDSVNIEVPLSMQDKDTVEAYYKDGNALLNLTISEESDLVETVHLVKDVIGEKGAITGSAVDNAVATESTVNEIAKIVMIAIPFCFLVLILTTSSWLQPVILLLSIGVAVIINMGSNLIFGEISFVTNAAGSILQLAVSLDYSVFLMHRFEETAKTESDLNTAMAKALSQSTSSILSSGLTTVIGFAALILMRFGIGPDMGMALAKGIALSLISTFTFLPVITLVTYKWIKKTQHRPLLPRFDKFAAFVTKVMIPAVIIFCIVMVPSYLGQQNNSFFYGSSEIFGEETELGQDTAEIEAVFGQSDTYVLLVPGTDFSFQKELCAELKTLPEVADTISYATQVGAEVPMEYLEETLLKKLISENYSRIVLSVSVPFEGEKTTKLIEDIYAVADKYYPQEYLLAGQGVSTYDLMKTISEDNLRVNLVAIAAVFIVLLLSFKSLLLPVILVLSIETAIWINLSIPYFTGDTLFYMGYLIISSIQLGATVDYAILMTSRYLEMREKYPKLEALKKTISSVSVSILTSAIILTVVGYILGIMTTHGLISQLGILLGQGTLCSTVVVFFVLPGLLFLLDRGIEKTTYKASFMKGSSLMTERTKNKQKTSKISGGKFLKKILAVFTAITLLFPTVAMAAEPTSLSDKEEVVYANLACDGSVQEGYAVNILVPDNEEISDFGEYSMVRNMTTTDELGYERGRVSCVTSAEKLYYEGELKNVELPWIFSVKYRLDGEDMTAEEIAGKSGSSEMVISVKQNPSQSGDYFDNFALQIALTLNTENFKNIVANGATVANIGANKQLTYTILPGNEKEIEISADVTEFEMDGISINGIHLSLDIEVDDDELMNQVNELLDAMAELDEGAGELEEGAAEMDSGVTKLAENTPTLSDGVDSLLNGSKALQDGIADAVEGARSLKNGAAEVKDGAISLNDGASDLNDGVLMIQSGLDMLNSKSESLVNGSAEVQSALGMIAQGVNGISVDTSQINTLVGSSSSIQSAISKIDAGILSLSSAVSSSGYRQAMASNGLDVDSLMAQNFSASESVSAAAGSLNSASAFLEATGDPELVAVAGQISSAANSLTGVSSLLSANTSAIYGACTYLDTVNASVSELSSGISSLNSQYGTFHSGVNALATSVEGMAGSLYTLKSGINQLVSEYSSLDSGLREYTDAVAQLVAGYMEIVDGSGTLLRGSYALKSGSISLYAGTIDLLDGMTALYSATGTLTDGTGQLSSSTAELVVGISALREGSSSLYSGSTALREGTSILNKETKAAESEIEEKIDDMLGSLKGDDKGTQSFASAKNGTIKSLQFVIKTPAIKNVEEVVDEVEEEKSESFFDKLSALFK